MYKYRYHLLIATIDKYLIVTKTLGLKLTYMFLSMLHINI